MREKHRSAFVGRAILNDGLVFLPDWGPDGSRWQVNETIETPEDYLTDLTFVEYRPSV